MNTSKIRFILAFSVMIFAAAYSAPVWAESPVIDLSLAPPVINADGESHEIIVIQLLYENGQPYMAPSNITVYLTSSNLDIGAVSEFIVIPEGKTYARGVFSSSFNAGLSLITASAEGFQMDDAILQAVKSDLDARLSVSAAPSLMPAVRGVEGRAVIQIIDYQGNPYSAIRDVHLTLSSSNHSVLTLPSTAVIPKGVNYVEVTYIVQGTLPGSAKVYAHAQNFEPGYAIVTITNETRREHSLALYFASGVLLPDKGTHRAVTVQLVDADGNPVKATKNTVVTLTSSNLNVATVTETLTIPKDQYHASTTVTTRSQVGDTTIGVSSPSLYPVDGTLTVRGALPRLLSLYAVPRVVIANGEDNEVLTVQLLDVEGDPIRADHDVSVYLSSSSSSVGTVPVSGTIPRGGSYVTLPFKATSRPGTASIIVATQGLEPAQATVQTVTLRMNVTLTTPKSIVLNQTFTVQVNVTSFDRVIAGAQVKWTALGGVIKSEDTATDEKGVARAEIAQMYEQLNLKVEIVKPGYMKETAQKSIKVTQAKRTELTVNILGYDVSLFLVLITLTLIVAAALGAYLYMKYRRRKQGDQQNLELFT